MSEPSDPIILTEAPGDRAFMRDALKAGMEWFFTEPAEHVAFELVYIGLQLVPAADRPKIVAEVYEEFLTDYESGVEWDSDRCETTPISSRKSRRTLKLVE